eukprot:scaffold65067_cov67-Phaeocystis_antarctica.AAC.3
MARRTSACACPLVSMRHASAFSGTLGRIYSMQRSRSAASNRSIDASGRGRHTPSLQGITSDPHAGQKPTKPKTRPLSVYSVRSTLGRVNPPRRL